MSTPITPWGVPTFSTQSFTYTPLLSDGDDIVSRSGTIASGGGIMKRGTIVKIDPTTGAITAAVAATDCNAILAIDADATSATVAAVVYVSGKFKADALIWPGALSHSAVSDALRNYSILVESVVFTDGTLVKSAPTEAEAAKAQENLDKARAAQKAKEEKAAAATPDNPPDDEPKPSDSAWAYLTAEEREKHPELAEEALEEGAKELAEKKAAEQQAGQQPVPPATGQAYPPQQ